jgi:hypothetical protein
MGMIFFSSPCRDMLLMLMVFVSVFMSKRVVGSVHVWLEVVCVVVVQSEKLAETGENKSNYVHNA